MPLYMRNYRKLWENGKRFEFRKRFTAIPTLWYVYISAPYFQIVGRIELGEPHYLPLPELLDFAASGDEPLRTRLTWYFEGYSHGYAIPILSLSEHEPVPRAELPGLARVPNGMLPLRWNRPLLHALEERFHDSPRRYLKYQDPHPEENVLRHG